MKTCSILIWGIKIMYMLLAPRACRRRRLRDEGSKAVPLEQDNPSLSVLAQVLQKKCWAIG